MAHVKFFYDLSSPWTYLAFNNIQPILAETGADITWRPFLVGGVFNAVNPSVYQARAEPMDPRLFIIIAGYTSGRGLRACRSCSQQRITR